MFTRLTLLVASSLLVACGSDGLDPIVGDGSVDAPMSDGDLDTGLEDSAVADGAVPDSSAPDSAPPVDSATPPADAPLIACTLEEIQPIVECASDACVMLPDAGLPGGDASLPDASLPDPGELATCIVTNCGVLVFGVSPECRGCLLAGVSMDLETIASSCAPGVMLP